ncbi:hypothetical protein CMQ_5202 [Grosmannia clavigera kw1407]|uniref:Uncharacterized protein n=1 Tax=Grosmannia clavigera (strain kw1407 / UAMH 11150) TaxID=655863 RepID=F0XBQ2_GROCL|nr:uncharacterized protein CMQ_5202 [Grosmannia clavigera kw1407]EFX04940.1 hypothetical protein CMQ_5202 [Grosmannia clavigera kw1407]
MPKPAIAQFGSIMLTGLRPDAGSYILRAAGPSRKGRGWAGEMEENDFRLGDVSKRAGAGEQSRLPARPPFASYSVRLSPSSLRHALVRGHDPHEAPEQRKQQRLRRGLEIRQREKTRDEDEDERASDEQTSGHAAVPHSL